MKYLIREIQEDNLSKAEILEDAEQFSKALRLFGWPEMSVGEWKRDTNCRIHKFIFNIKENNLGKKEIIAELRIIEKELANWFDGYYYDSGISKIRKIKIK